VNVSREYLHILSQSASQSGSDEMTMAKLGIHYGYVPEGNDEMAFIQFEGIANNNRDYTSSLYGDGWVNERVSNGVNAYYEHKLSPPACSLSPALL